MIAEAYASYQTYHLIKKLSSYTYTRTKVFADCRGNSQYLLLCHWQLGVVHSGCHDINASSPEVAASSC